MKKQILYFFDLVTLQKKLASTNIYLTGLPVNNLNLRVKIMMARRFIRVMQTSVILTRFF